LVVEEADPRFVATVTGEGHATDLDEAEMAAVGLDPFLIAYGMAADTRCVVSFEISAPSKRRANLGPFASVKAA
jgi:hypothetical protein